MRSVLLVTTIDAVGITRLPRLLADADIATTLLASPRSAIWHTRHARNRVPGHSDVHLAAHQLQRHLESNVYDAVICGDEPLLWALLEETSPPAAWLRPWFPVDVTDRVASWAAFSKIAFWLALIGADPAVVADGEVAQDANDARRIAGQLGYPVVLKVEQGLSGSGVRLVETPEQLTREYDALGQQAAVLVQRFIAGDVGTTPVLYHRGAPVCWFSGLLRENWPTPMAASSGFEIFDHPELEPMLRAIGEITRFNGLAGIDWIRDRSTGRLYALELNPRPTPGMYLGPYAGVSFPEAIRDWLTGAARIQRPTKGQGQLLRMFPQNLYFAWTHRRFGQLLSVLGDAPIDDPTLAAAHLRRAFTHFLPESVRNAARRIRKS